jgi:hypothetical protein
MDTAGNPLVVNSHYKMGYGQYAPNCRYLGLDAPPNNTVMLFSCKLHTGRIRKIRRNIHSGETYVPFTPGYDDVWTDSEDTDSDVEGGGYNGVKKTKKRKTKKRKTKKRKTRRIKTRRIKRRYTKK